MSEASLPLPALAEPLPEEDIEWRVMRSGTSDRGVWAKVIAYTTARGVQERLDLVCGVDGWQVEFREGPRSLMCGIGIAVNGHWVWKWDGTGHMQPNEGLDSTDAGKADYSNALKRAAAQWGIGRYLYRLSESFAEIRADGANYGRTRDGTSFRWNPPELPDWARPGGTGVPPQDYKPTASSDSEPTESRSDFERILNDTPILTPARPTPTSGSPDDWRNTPVGFGKHKDQTWGYMVDNEPGYVQWALEADVKALRGNNVLKSQLQGAVTSAAGLDKPDDELPW